jgi:hypothetical protein
MLNQIIACKNLKNIQKAMKSTMFKICLVAAVFLAAFAQAGQAAEVTPQTAEQAARTFWNLHHDKDVAELNSPMHRLDIRWDAFYIFAPAEGKGFVIVAADDRVRPVLAYSFHNNAMRDTVVGPAMSWWLDGWQQQIDDLRKEKGKTRNEEWKQLLEGKGIPQPLTVVDPLLTTQWDDGSPYNDSCPRHPQNNTLSSAGCVATAMAQVMKYWNYPERGTGTFSYNSDSFFGLGPHFGIQTVDFGATVYDWENMPDILLQSSPDVQKAAVATLMYHCGVACETTYDVSGSGSYILSVPWPRSGHALNGMIKFFGYSSSATGMIREKYDDNSWTTLMRGELDASRPIIYGGGTNYLHCFVCDGYDDENRYHFNWGWSGDGDGFYTLNNLKPSGSSYNFSSGQQMLVGIQPHTGDDSLCIIRHFPHTEDFETAPACWEATSSKILYSYSWMIVDSTGVDGNYSAGAFKSIYGNSEDHLFSPAIVTPGDYKVTWQVCSKNASVSDFYTLNIDTVTFSDTVASTAWLSREVLFSVAEGDTMRLDFGHICDGSSGGVLIDNIVIERMSGVGIHNIATAQTIHVYPNPTNGHITIEGMPEDGRIEVYDATGRLIKESTKPQINISARPAGVYILRIVSSDGVTVRRVIKR